MDLKFDERGYLHPYGRIPLSLEKFEELFVTNFSKDSNRNDLFEKLQKYLLAFQNEVTPNFIVWINGSFVTKKLNPGDIDMVSLVDFEIIRQHAMVIREKFKGNGAISQFGIDAYILEIFPEGHENHFFSTSDKAFWHDWFSATKINRAKKRIPKGYVEIQFKTSENG